jgi:hypothetical protein
MLKDLENVLNKLDELADAYTEFEDAIGIVHSLSEKKVTKCIDILNKEFKLIYEVADRIKDLKNGEFIVLKWDEFRPLEEMYCKRNEDFETFECYQYYIRTNNHDSDGFLESFNDEEISEECAMRKLINKYSNQNNN